MISWYILHERVMIPLAICSPLLKNSVAKECYPRATSIATAVSVFNVYHYTRITKY